MLLSIQFNQIDHKTMAKLLLLIDSNAIIHRAYHAYPPSLQTKEGVLTNAAFGFSVILLETLQKFKPDYVVCAFDESEKTFRHEQFADYKANRKPMPDDLRAQFPLVKEIVQALSIPIFSQKGYEADDLIGTIVKLPQLHDLQKIIVTGDQDILQLITDEAKTAVYLAGSTYSASKLYAEADVMARYEFLPPQIVDYKALLGDPSDNIPGVPGIGKKGATDLLKEFGDLDTIFKTIEANDPRWQEKQWHKLLNKILAGLESAKQSYSLAQIYSSIPLDFALASAQLSDYDPAKVTEIFKRFEFNSLLKRLPNSQYQTAVEPTPNNQKMALPTSQPQLFAVQSPKVELNLSGEQLHTRQYLNTIAAALRFISQAATAQIVAFDTETDAKAVIKAKILGLGLAFKFENNLVSGFLPATVLQNSQVKEALSELFSGLWSQDNKPRLPMLPELPKFIGHNLKYDLHILCNAGIISKEQLAALRTDEAFDTMIAIYLLQAGEVAGKGLKELALTYLNWQMTSLSDLTGTGRSKLEMEAIPLADLGSYCCDDCIATLRLFELFKVRIAKIPTTQKVFAEIEMPLVATILRMESEGVYLDLKVLQAVEKEAVAELDRLRKAIYDSAKTEFNIASPKQVSDLLFVNLKIQEISGKFVTKTKSGAYSTDERTLLNFSKDHDLVQLILDYRQISKIMSTYIRGLGKELQDNGKIHTSYSQTVASTGRLSSNDPNLQNIPIASELGSKIRSAFTPGEGRVFVAFDYAQQELRLLAHLSQEDKLIKAFQENLDIHSLTASEILQIPLTEVTVEQRRIGKTVNFGIVYGISGFGLADRLKIEQKTAQEFITAFFGKYPKIKEYFASIKTQALNQGEIFTLLGRRRDASALRNANARVRGGLERELLNFPLQGGAADIMKLAMLQIDRLLQNPQAAEIDSKLRQLLPTVKLHLQVHDELILSVPADTEKELLKNFSNVVKTLMAEVVVISVPLLTDAEVGQNWQHMEKIN